ncbi:MAG: hypothetical protein ACM3ME_09045 [Chloroflexota bacterium]|nr:hypothetical protein [Lentimicrobium sp.]
MRKISYSLKLLQKGFIILWASAILWFYLGNLVNFHQNRIWGKYLIPACFTHSSVNNKDFGASLTSVNDSFSSLLKIDLNAVSNITEVLITPVEFNNNCIPFPEEIRAEYSVKLKGILLRGPPVA